MEAIFGLSMATMAVLALIPIALAIWALVDLASKPLDTTTKIVWALVIVVFPVIGSIASLIINGGRSRTVA
jgi:hypothetical protein